MQVSAVLLFTVLVSDLYLPVLNKYQAKEVRIINGQQANLGQFPWQAAILSSSLDFIRFCSGAIISEFWILTAANCVDGADGLRVYTGSITTLAARITDVDNHTIHDEYNSATLNNDIAVVRLQNPLVFDANTNPIPLADDWLDVGVDVVVSGWGQTLTNDTGRSSLLNFIEVSTIDNKECEAIYGSNSVTSSVVCTNADGPVMSPCFGDTGDPMVANFGTSPVHVGIFSFLSTFGCGQKFPAGYTRTAYYRDWIKKVTGV